MEKMFVPVVDLHSRILQGSVLRHAQDGFPRLLAR